MRAGREGEVEDDNKVLLVSAALSRDPSDLYKTGYRIVLKKFLQTMNLLMPPLLLVSMLLLLCRFLTLDCLRDFQE